MNRRDLYFEDYTPGAVFEAGPVTVSETEIIDFARQYDPQTMHTDPEAAKSLPLGGLIASGWQTTMLAMRLIVDNFISPVANQPAPGIDELRWLKPVYPGDSLRVRVTVVDSRVSRSKPDRGIVNSVVEILNQKDDVVMTMKPITIVLRRPPAAAGPAS